MTRLFTTIGLITKVDAVDALEVFDNRLQELEERYELENTSTRRPHPDSATQTVGSSQS